MVSKPALRNCVSRSAASAFFLASLVDLRKRMSEPCPRLPRPALNGEQSMIQTRITLANSPHIWLGIAAFAAALFTILLAFS